MKRLVACAAFLIAGCTAATPAPPPEVPSPPVTAAPAVPDGPKSADVVQPNPRSEEPPVTPAEPTGSFLLPEPVKGLLALVESVPGGLLERVRLEPGTVVTREGLYFMGAETGALEGWLPKDLVSIPDRVSPDNRWLSGSAGDYQYAVDRKTGQTYRWSRARAHLLAARGDLLFFVTGSRFWLVAGDWSLGIPVAITPTNRTLAEIAPDGRSVMLLNYTALHRIDADTGEARLLHEFDYAAGDRDYLHTWVSAGGSIEAGAASYQREGAEIVRYSWQGEQLLHRRSAPGQALLSPDGKQAAWGGDLLGFERTVTVGSVEFEPRLRLRGEMRCSLPHQGPYWLADSSALAVATSRGPRLLFTDGRLEEFPAGRGLRVAELPVPAPERADRFVAEGRVLGADGAVLAAARYQGPILGYLHPWGERSDEVRLQLHFGGKGVTCDPGHFEPAVDVAPLPSYEGLRVKVAQGDCVNLRHDFSRSAPPVACLPGGTLLTPVTAPGVLGKGGFASLGNPVMVDMGSEYWWYVRTPRGQRGYVMLSGEYLDWAAGSPPLIQGVEDRADEVANLRHWLQVALGEIPCTVSCGGSPSFGEPVAAILERCDRDLPAPTADAQPGAALEELQAPCAALKSTRERLGAPTDSPAWREAMRKVLAAIPAP